jgi:hypothetical protein
MEDGKGSCGPCVGGGLLLQKQHKLVKAIHPSVHLNYSLSAYVGLLISLWLLLFHPFYTNNTFVTSKFIVLYISDLNAKTVP